MRIINHHEPPGLSRWNVLMTDAPHALHITWTTYATWLPGDARGYVGHTLDNPGDWQPRQNIPGTPYAEDHERTRDNAKELQKWAAARLTPELARIVAEELLNATAKRSWSIIRAAIMAQHCHVLVTDCPPDGPEVRRILKGTTQAALSRAVGAPRRWWTAGGSDRHKNDWLAIETCSKYIEDQEHILVAIHDNRIVANDVPPG
jgi:REP element-mobilizing transposase RayT